MEGEMTNGDPANAPQEELADFLSTLRGQDLSDGEVEAAAGWLLRHRDAALPLLQAAFADPEEDPALLAVAMVTLQSWPEPHPVKPLMALMKRPEVGALGKALIMKVLERYGIDVDGTGLVGVGIDLEAYKLNPMIDHPGVSPN
jgi:hypothetical protein